MVKYSRLIKNRISTSRNQRKCFPSLIFLYGYILSRRSVFALIEAFIKGETKGEIAVASIMIEEESESRSALLLIRNLVNSRFFLRRRFSFLAFSRYSLRSFSGAFGSFEINPSELASEPRRSKVCSFWFGKSDIVVTMSLFLWKVEKLEL